jgi:hypothetical protein
MHARCPVCEFPNPPNARNCLDCGVALGEEPPRPPVSSFNWHSRNVLLALGGFFGLIIVLAVYSYRTSSQTSVQPQPSSVTHMPAQSETQPSGSAGTAAALPSGTGADSQVPLAPEPTAAEKVAGAMFNSKHWNQSDRDLYATNLGLVLLASANPRNQWAVRAVGTTVQFERHNALLPTDAYTAVSGNQWQDFMEGGFTDARFITDDKICSFEPAISNHEVVSHLKECTKNSAWQTLR